MELSSKSRLWHPENTSAHESVERVTHLGIGAHADDVEFMALPAIGSCFADLNQWFGCVTCTDGSGSPRVGPYSEYSAEDMVAIRSHEQIEAARMGNYSCCIQLFHPSTVARKPDRRGALANDLYNVLKATRPKFVYTHNLADFHPTHLGVAVATIEAIRELPEEERPEYVYGCEVWRGLTWLPESFRLAFDIADHADLAIRLASVFQSQIAAGKRYDIALSGRRRPNASFEKSVEVNTATDVVYALDLNPLIHDPLRPIKSFVEEFADAFKKQLLDDLSMIIGE